jgi:hypothetical protein
MIHSAAKFILRLINAHLRREDRKENLFNLAA